MSIEYSSLRQGKHPDPLVARTMSVDRRGWSERQSRAFESVEMGCFRTSLLMAGRADTRESVLDDLSSYFGLDADKCVERCLNWEAWSVQEWKAESRKSPDGLTRFYRETVSWAFDLLWWGYLQAEGYAYPGSVVAARSLKSTRGLRHLDFGAGVGITSQLFQGLGFETDLADISSSLLAFARFRIERRGGQASYIDLNDNALEPERYDVITAIDTLAHVPDIGSTAAALHRSLKAGGVLFANFDVRQKSAENAWHLYEDDLPLRWQLQRAGFEPEERLDGLLTRYRKVAPKGIGSAYRGLRDTLLLRGPLRPAWRSARRQLHSRGQRS